VRFSSDRPASWIGKSTTSCTYDHRFYDKVSSQASLVHSMSKVLQSKAWTGLALQPTRDCGNMYPIW